MAVGRILETQEHRYLQFIVCSLYLGWKVYLVAGGLNNNYERLSSTELLTTHSPTWSMTSPLPRTVYGFRGVTVWDILYMTGMFHG